MVKRIFIPVLLVGGNIDTISPTITILSTESDGTTANPIPIVITFSENVIGFTVDDIVVTGCTLSNFAGSGANYTVDATPIAAAMTFNIAAGVCQDATGNPNTAATQFAITSGLFLTLTATTTGAQTLTLQGLTVAAGKSVTVFWGDGNSNTYTAGAGTRTHDYAGAGIWTVSIRGRENITLLNLQDTKIGAIISSTNPLPSGLTSLTLSALSGLTYNANTNPLPSGLTSLTLYTLPGLTYNANTNPLPSGLTYLALSTLPGLTWEINGSQPYPIGVTAAIILACDNVTIAAWTQNTIHTIRWESNCNQAKVDSIIAAIYANRANFTFAAPQLDIAGGGNATPSGSYAEETPPTTGLGMVYELVNDPKSEGFNRWLITYTP